LWYVEPNAIGNAIGYAEHRSRSHRAVIRVYDGAGNVIATHEHATGASRHFKFQKRSQLFICVHNETLSVAAVRVSNPDRSPVGINR
jgi:hypothetical protein